MNTKMFDTMAQLEQSDHIEIPLVFPCINGNQKRFTQKERVQANIERPMEAKPDDDPLTTQNINLFRKLKYPSFEQLIQYTWITQEDKEDKEECPLCHQEYIQDQKITLLFCNHYSHTSCMKEYLRTSNICFNENCKLQAIDHI